MASPIALSTQIGTALARMSERERRLVMLTVGVAVALVLLAGVMLVGSSLDKRQKLVALRRDEIGQLETLRDKYQEAVQTETRSAQRIQNNTASLFSLMQKSAGEVGLSLTDLNERRTPVKDAADITEVSVDVTLKEISIDKLDTLLEKIEGARTDGVVKVQKLKVKTRFDKPELLETTMTVATWKKATTPGAPPPPPEGEKP
jgi:hypothetical protein